MKGILAALPLFIGFLLDCLFGDPENLPHPVRFIGRMISALETMLRKIMPRHLFLAGGVLVLLVLLISTAVPAILLGCCYRIHILLGIAVESTLCYYLLAAKCLKQESTKVEAALLSGDLPTARKAVGRIVGRDTENLDAEGVIRAAVETVAENTSDGVTAPIFWMMIGGAPLGFLYKAVNTMDSMVGYLNDRYRVFGRCAARLDDFFNFIPSRITAVFMIAASRLLSFHSKDALRIWKRDRRCHTSPNSAQTESVCAGALGIQLGGDASYFGSIHHKPTIGDALRPPAPEDIQRANALMYTTAWLMLVAAVAIRILIGVTIL